MSKMSLQVVQNPVLLQMIAQKRIQIHTWWNASMLHLLHLNRKSTRAAFGPNRALFIKTLAFYWKYMFMVTGKFHWQMIWVSILNIFMVRLNWPYILNLRPTWITSTVGTFILPRRWPTLIRVFQPLSGYDVREKLIPPRNSLNFVPFLLFGFSSLFFFWIRLTRIQELVNPPMNAVMGWGSMWITCFNACTLC